MTTTAPQPMPQPTTALAFPLSGPLTGAPAALPDLDLVSRREAVVAEHIRAECAGDVAGVLATFPDGASYTIKPLGVGHDGDDQVQGLLEGLCGGFPDLLLEPQRVHHSADTVIIEGRMTGTQAADWGGSTARGGRMDVEAAVLFRFGGPRGDRLLNETVYYDHLTVLGQLTGQLPGGPPA